MITFQTHCRYAGDAVNAPIKTVTLGFQVPVYEYVGSGADPGDASLKNRATLTPQQDIVRRDTGATEASSIDLGLVATTYRVELADAAIAGRDDAERVRAAQYYGRALLAGNIDKLLSAMSVHYLTTDGVALGSQSFDVIVLVAFTADDPSKVVYYAVNKAAYATYRQGLAATSLKGDDSLALQALSFVMSPSADSPTLRGDVAADFARWLDRTTRGTDADAILEVIGTAFDALFDFSLAIPEIKTLTIAGTVTLTPAAGDTVAPKDFQDLEVFADCDFAAGPSRSLSFRYADTSKITTATAPFTLASVYSNGLQNPVTVRVRGFGIDLWSSDFAPDDPRLPALAIKIQKPARLILTKPPQTSNESAAKKLRGRVLTLDKDCPLDGVTVVIQAKAKDAAAWKTVGAGTTDASGNFGIPYPYGTYVAARAIVSLSPTETADIPCSDTENESIADDFLYLLLTRPDCAPPSSTKDCACEGTDVPNRLPDHSDLIGSDAYTQDIGGACVNLSKPNRTISEFSYQAIVRASDPDVANYTLTRVETGLDAIDVSLMVGLSNGASELLSFTSAARAAAAQQLANMPTAGAGLFAAAMDSALPYAVAIATAFNTPSIAVTATVLATSLHQVDSVIALVGAYQTRIAVEDIADFPPEARRVLESANRLQPLVAYAIDSLGSAARYELRGGTSLRRRAPVSLANPIAWQDDPETVADSANALTGRALIKAARFGGGPPPPPPPNATFSQAVSVATGHLLHYKAVFKSDGYSLGDLLYSLPLAPGQKKEIVVFDSSHTLVGAETQTQAQNERLALGLINERDIATQIAGSITESMRGSSTANTSGISAGFGTGGQGYGGTGTYGGSGSAVLGVAGGAANANANANQDSSRDVAEFFGEKLRQQIMQNAEGYRQLNASVVTTVQEGQRYGVTSEVVANHNHCHALTMMYFEVLRHYAIFHELSSVEECVFVPLLLTKFSTENVARWRDVLAPALLPMPSETYLKSTDAHPLLKAFDADQRIRTNYANVDMPAGSYDDERIRFIRGYLRLRVSIPRPRTRFDRIMSLPIGTQTITSREIDPEATQAAALAYPRKMAEYATKTAVTAGFNVLFAHDMPPDPPGLQYKTVEKEILVREAIFDAFMKLDANYETVPPAQCIRVINFRPPPKISLGVFGQLPVSTTTEDFFAENVEDQQQWQAYATLLGYTDVATFLEAHFRGNLISEWDTIFNNDIVPLAFEKILQAVYLEKFAVDFAPDIKYRGGERFMRVNLAGTTTLKRNELPDVIRLELGNNTVVTSLKKYIQLDVLDVNITYSTPHYNGTLFSGSVNDDLLDGTQLFIPESSDEKRNPRREDRYLAAKLIEHLNSNLEYYNKVLWYNLDPDRRYMLLDGFTIQIYDDQGTAITTSDGMRSLASVVKNNVIAIAGNSLVMPVAPGYRVNGAFVQKTAEGDTEIVTLFDHYKPLTPPEPFRVSVPSKGVFVEAVQGVCNACEKIETERLQDWNRFPNTDEPTAINPITPPTPTVTDWRAAFKDFATPIVNIQNAPPLPAPGDGLQSLADLLSKAGVFKDITGLDATQQNVLRTYLSNQDNAKAFAEMAKDMAMQQHNTQNTGKIMDQIKSAKDAGAISQDDYGKLTKDHLQQQIDGGQTKKAELAKDQQAAPNPLAKAFVDATGDGRGGTASVVDPNGGSQSYNISPGTPGQTLAENWKPVPIVKQQPDKFQNDCWACATAMLLGWNESRSITAEAAVTRAGQRYLTMYQQDTGLLATDKDDFLLRMQMQAEPPASNGPQYYIDLLKRFGPLWITTDAVAKGGVFSPHARILKKISGTGTADGAGTDFTFIDPAAGVETTESFATFMQSFEQLVRDDASATPTVQVVHFANEIGKKGEGYQIRGPFNVNEPIHEMVTLAALANAGIAIPDGTNYRENPIVNEYLRGVLWNDDPAILLFDEDPDSNWNFSFGVAWYARFTIAEHSTDVDFQNLTGRSHYFDLQFLHGMAPTLGEDPHDTLAKILLWAEVMYKVAIGDIAPSTRLADVAVVSSQTAGAATFAYQLASFFDDKTFPKGTDTINYLLTQDTAYHGVDIHKRALGSLLHLVEDSYARGHVKRRILNPTDLDAGAPEPLTFKPGKFGRFGEVENFHCYKGQDHDAHDKYDKPGPTPPDPRDLTTFNAIVGARDAIDIASQLIQLWKTSTPWDAPGGAKELLTGTVFKLSVAVTASDSSV